MIIYGVQWPKGSHGLTAVTSQGQAARAELVQK